MPQKDIMSEYRACNEKNNKKMSLKEEKMQDKVKIIKGYVNYIFMRKFQRFKYSWRLERVKGILKYSLS